MFWGSFSYDKKGPFHIWKPETKAEKKQAEEEIAKINGEKEAEAKEQWELETAFRRINLSRKPGGKKPTWKFTKANGALVRTAAKGGIDFWRYQKIILNGKLLPFAKQCQIDRPSTIVQEDKAPAHDKWEVERLLWPGNSPDLNVIEAAWPWMKRNTTKKGPTENLITATKVWTKAWNNLPQEKIQKWIERIPRHIEKIIELEGGNYYREGHMKNEVIDNVRPYISKASKPRGQRKRQSINWGGKKRKQ